ncbi:MAG TPA: hypothetical protein EYQ79_03350 [Flavobacteriaceae bacterium]|nr:hypothetical protein [Flavobacteriaceae bacterium]
MLSSEEEDVIEQNLLEFLKGKVYHKDTPEGKRYVEFDLSFLLEEDTAIDGRGKQYEGWIYYEKHNDDIEEKGCFFIIECILTILRLVPNVVYRYYY